MSTQTHDTPMDRTDWGPGPWDGEPDRFEWKTKTGHPAMAIRNSMGAWCGYVGVPLDKAADYNDLHVDVHGGLTYGAPCAGHICHTPAPGEPDEIFWFGFDCSHYLDYAPASEARLRSYGERGDRLGETIGGHTIEYRTLDYVKSECESLAVQLSQIHAAVS